MQTVVLWFLVSYGGGSMTPAYTFSPGMASKADCEHLKKQVEQVMPYKSVNYYAACLPVRVAK